MINFLTHFIQIGVIVVGGFGLYIFSGLGYYLHTGKLFKHWQSTILVATLCNLAYVTAGLSRYYLS